jgi:UDP-N-acetylmuramate--alanine ligase
MTHVHLIGIGGTGLSAIALVLLERGYTVSGSDRQISPLAQRVRQAGAQVFHGHSPENVRGADLVVRSSAIPDDNSEVQAALKAGVPVLKRADYLGQLMRDQNTIAVAGTHGKTTTTAMIAWVLTALGQDPSYIIGGVSTNLGTNAHAGKGDTFVVEADEYDRMFLGLNPNLAVVTNIEHDHPDCYPTAADFYQAFVEFAKRLTPRLTPQGTLLVNADDPGASRLGQEAAGWGAHVLSYALQSPEKDYWASALEANPRGGYSFQAHHAGRSVEVHLQVPGRHNASNALAALAISNQLDLPWGQAAQALGQFSGTGRRFEVLGQAAGITLIDDYAHHPTEIRATLAAARSRYPGRRIWAVWQPHTYSRTRALLDQFRAAFEDADRVLVTEIYAAREAAPQNGFSGEQVAAVIDRPQVAFTPALAQAEAFLLEHLQSDDVVLVLSAGDADRISATVFEALRERQS